MMKFITWQSLLFIFTVITIVLSMGTASIIIISEWTHITVDHVDFRQMVEHLDKRLTILEKQAHGFPSR